MNPLTQIKRIKEINLKEASLGISEDASWHAKYKESPYVYVGGLPFDLTEGDLLAIFAQYGEIVDVNLVRHKDTGKSKGFAFVAYEDQRSTNLAVDNLNGADVLGRTIRVDHVSKYKKKEEEDEEMEQEKREARGVCRAFQRGDCTRGATCKFSHNEQRCANTGWGAKEDNPKWEHDKHEVPPIKSGRSAVNFPGRIPESRNQEGASNSRSYDKPRLSRPEDEEEGRKSYHERSEVHRERRGSEKQSGNSEKEPNHRYWDRQGVERRSGTHDSEPKSREDWDGRRREERSRRHEAEKNPRDNDDRKVKSGRHDTELNPRELNPRKDWDRKGREERSLRDESERNPRENHDRKKGRHDSELNLRENQDRDGREESARQQESERRRRDDYERRGGEKRQKYDEDSSNHRHREEDEVQARRARR